MTQPLSSDEQLNVVGYYALAAGSIAGDAAPGRLLRSMPDPLPVIVLGRLAAKAFYQKHGFVESPLDPLTVLVGLR